MNTLFLLTCMFTVSGASGQGVTAVTDNDVQHDFSLTISPVHLAFPVVELTGEYRLADKWGAAGILGAGKIKTETSTFLGTEKESYTIFEAGAQLRYYVLGSFIHGMQLGAEAMYTYVGRDGKDSVAVSGEGFSVGPFIGYKIATNSGFTFDTQFGFQRVVVRGKSSAANISGEASMTAPLLNLNLGWSF